MGPASPRGKGPQEGGTERGRFRIQNFREKKRETLERGLGSNSKWGGGHAEGKQKTQS